MSESPVQNVSSTSRLNCLQCHDVGFSSPNALRKHIETQHSQVQLEPHQYPVQGCSFSSSQRGEVKAHLRSHAAKRDKAQIAKLDTRSEGNDDPAPVSQLGHGTSTINAATERQRRNNGNRRSVLRSGKARVRFAPYARSQSSGPSMQMSGGLTFSAGSPSASTRTPFDPTAFGLPPPSTANFYAPVKLPGPIVHNPIPLSSDPALPIPSTSTGRCHVTARSNSPPLQQWHQPCMCNIDRQPSIASPPQVAPYPLPSFPRGVPDELRQYLEFNILS